MNLIERAVKAHKPPSASAYRYSTESLRGVAYGGAESGLIILQQPKSARPVVEQMEPKEMAQLIASNRDALHRHIENGRKLPEGYQLRRSLDGGFTFLKAVDGKEQSLLSLKRLESGRFGFEFSDKVANKKGLMGQIAQLTAEAMQRDHERDYVRKRKIQEAMERESKLRAEAERRVFDTIIAVLHLKTQGLMFGAEVHGPAGLAMIAREGLSYSSMRTAMKTEIGLDVGSPVPGWKGGDDSYRHIMAVSAEGIEIGSLKVTGFNYALDLDPAFEELRSGIESKLDALGAEFAPCAPEKIVEQERGFSM